MKRKNPNDVKKALAAMICCFAMMTSCDDRDDKDKDAGVNGAYWQVTWNLNGGAWPADDDHATKVARDGALAEPAAPVKSGNTFDGWYLEAELTNRVGFPYDASSLTGNFTLYARWDETAPLGTLNVTVMPVSGTFTSITAMRVSSGYPPQYTIPSGAGTHTLKVSPGTYYIFYVYWSCPYPSCMSNGNTSNFYVPPGGTRDITVTVSR
ncbi:MAG: InlB B-repeat-containing protein [Tannerella sp.]|jgi:uncharacterized repeat protein (TIGR02543 family)|nr:InlB B-repeat-containing protein [Tannerella sp.]